MKTLMLGKLAIVIVAAIVLAVQMVAQETPRRIIVVCLEDRKPALVENGQVKKVCPPLTLRARREPPAASMPPVSSPSESLLLNGPRCSKNW